MNDNITNESGRTLPEGIAEHARENLERVAGDRRIMLAWLGGSWAHGLADEHSDNDARGVATESRRNILRQRTERTIHNQELDVMVTTLDAFVGQLTKGSPNLLEALFVPEGLLLAHDAAADELRANRDRFVCSATVHALIGMAVDERRKLTSANASRMDERRIAKMKADALRQLHIAAYVERTGSYEVMLEDDVQRHLRDIRSGAAYAGEGGTAAWSEEYDGMSTICAELHGHTAIRDMSEENREWALNLLETVNEGIVMGR